MYSSLWANSTGDKCYAIKDNDLVKINYDLSLTVLSAGVGPLELSFEEIEDVVYFTSPSYNGIIENDVVRTWGIASPSRFPTLSIGNGILAEGEYQVSYSYLDSEGRESGVSGASRIIVPESSGITLTPLVSSDPRVSYINIYCSTQNGTVLYYISTISQGSSYTISDQTVMSSPLRTFNLDDAPKGSLTTYYRGRVYIAVGRTLYYSNVNSYEYFTLDSDYIELPSEITELMPVEDGIWVGADNIYYVSGTDPNSFKLTLKERVEVVSGTSKRFSGSYILLENTPIGYKWLVTTNLGIFVLFNQGVIMNLTATNLSLERGSSGTSVFLQDEGMNQYLSVIKKNDKPNNSVVGDVVTTSIVRNGITIG